MNIVLWILQVLLALMFLMVGFMKTVQPIEQLAKRMDWVKSYPASFVRFIGISEILGGIGLILPALTHILPWLTIAAAIGLAVVMICAFAFHLSRKEYSHLLANVVPFVLFVFIVLGRLMLAPF